MPVTIAALHAHPDDEVLLTGGTLAAAVAAGHQVVLITATRGEAGLTDRESANLGAMREAELRRAAAILGCHEVVMLGHQDSGMACENSHGYARQPVAELGEQLLEVLRSRTVGVLLGYDRRGGYGHPDHVQVHRVARFAAHAVPSLRLLEATVDRTALTRALRIAARLPFVTASWDAAALASAFSDAADIAYRVNVRRYAAVKRAAMLAHRTQSVGGEGDRTLELLSKLPMPLFRFALGTEWFGDPFGAGGTFLGATPRPGH